MRVSRDAVFRFLRQKLLVLRRSAPAKLRLGNTDRLIFVSLYRLFPSLRNAEVIFKPEALVHWHCAGSVCSGDGSESGEADALPYQPASVT